MQSLGRNRFGGQDLGNYKRTRDDLNELLNVYLADSYVSLFFAFCIRGSNVILDEGVAKNRETL